MQPESTALVPADNKKNFNFALQDLAYWVVRRKDGTVAKFMLGDNIATAQAAREGRRPQNGTPMVIPAFDAIGVAQRTSLSAFCRHEAKEPVFETDKFTMSIADGVGVKAQAGNFDIVIDCGDVLLPKNFELTPPITGDPAFTKLLKAHVKPSYYKNATPPRLIQIEWWDRQAPPLEPKAWTELALKLEGDVVINCEGGHGRSGTGLVCLLMATHPEYTPLDGIIQLRALHCPRAIESIVQHEYLNEVGKFLGRKENALDDIDIKDYRGAFQALKLKGASKYQGWLKQRMEKKSS